MKVWPSSTIEKLVAKLSLPTHSFLSLLIGNRLTNNTPKKYPTPLEVALSVLLAKEAYYVHA